MSKRGSYNEFQFAWWILILIPVWLGVIIATEDRADLHLISILISPITILCVLIALLFYGMKTTVTGSKITIAFGIGLIRKSIDLSTVQSVKSVKNQWYYGWGIRMIPNGWLYNIAGLRAVEIKRKDKNSVLRIGSKHPEILRKVISDGISDL